MDLNQEQQLVFVVRPFAEASETTGKYASGKCPNTLQIQHYRTELLPHLVHSFGDASQSEGASRVFTPLELPFAASR
jgi:hypothetical protein